MQTLIRFILALFIGAAFMDLYGMQPAMFSNMITTWGSYAYIGASLTIAWLLMPSVSYYFDG
jgi:hypothetical protein